MIVYINVRYSFWIWDNQFIGCCKPMYSLNIQRVIKICLSTQPIKWPPCSRKLSPKSTKFKRLYSQKSRIQIIWIKWWRCIEEKCWIFFHISIEAATDYGNHRTFYHVDDTRKFFRMRHTRAINLNQSNYISEHFNTFLLERMKFRIFREMLCRLILWF